MVTLHVKRRRGQGTTELALGLLIFVTVLIFGIHFAEVGYLSLKVQEAAASALWDTTGARMHELPGNFAPLRNIISGNKPGQYATERFQDFDGRSSKTGGQAPVQVFTSASGMEVTCGAAADIAFRPSGPTTGVYENVGGMRCSARAVLSPTRNLTRSFLDRGQGAFFDVQHYAMGVIPVCGTGRADGGRCAGNFGILLDDWGLAGAAESGECPVLREDGCANKPYYDSAKKVYEARLPGLSAARALANDVVGSAPIDPGKFWMSFIGMNSFQDRENGGDSDPNNWVTTPGANSPTTQYSTAFDGRGHCFLGEQCN
jgi:hypothetical protein